MNLKITTAPASEPVTVADAKEHLRLSANFTGDDTYVDGLLKAARRRVERHIRRALITQTITLELDSVEVEDPIWLPRPPHQSVTTIKTFDDDDVATTVDSSAFRTLGDNPMRITQVDDGWNVDRRLKAMEIVYVAGYGDEAADVPGEIRTAIKMEVASLYEHRGDAEMPALFALTNEILHNYRYDFL